MKIYKEIEFSKVLFLFYITYKLNKNGKGENKMEKAMSNIIKGVGISLLTTFLLLLIFAVILTYTETSETIINPVIIVITAISILIGSSIGSIKIKKNGLLNGALIGGLYILTIYIISSILNWRFSLEVQSIIMIAIGIIFGILGGIIGVNKK